MTKRLRPEQRFDYLCVIGLIVIDSCPESGESCEIKDFLAGDYKGALAEALPLILETLASRHDVTQTRYLLAAVAALKGHCKLAAALRDMDCICAECPKCGECIYPEELQKAIR